VKFGLVIPHFERPRAAAALLRLQIKSDPATRAGSGVR